MDAHVLLFSSVAVYTVFPIAFALMRGPFQYVLLYTHIAAALTLGGLLGAVYVFPLRGDVSLLAGQLCYGAFMFSTMVAVIAGRDIQVLRNIVVLTVAVDALVYGVFLISNKALTGGDLPNPLGVPSAMFDQSLRIVVFGGVLILAELCLLIAILEFAKRYLRSWAMAPVYVISYVAILTLDGVLFPTFVLLPDEGLGAFIRSGVEAKAYLAAAFAVPLAVFVALLRPTLASYEATPLRLRALFSVSRDELLESLDRQQAELESQRARVLSTSRHAGRAVATVDRILDSATDTLLIATDADGRITHWSAGATAILGWDAGAARGRTVGEMCPQDEWERHAVELGTEPVATPLLEAHAAVRERRDWRLRHRSGDPRVLSLRVTRIEVGDEVDGYVVAGVDVTVRRRAERAFEEAMHREQEAMVRLQEADAIKRDLVSTVSHETLTPLTTIRGYVEMLSTGILGELTDRQQAALEKISRGTARLEGLSTDLVTLARVDERSLTLRPQEVDLRDVVRASSEVLAEVARGRDVDLSLELPTTPVTLQADPVALERAVAHLINNAIKFSRPEGRVRAVVQGDEDGARVTIADAGRGIPADEQAQLFDRFFRGADSGADAIQGSGLGLSVVAAIVSAHEGTVELESRVDSGTTVVVRLPARRS